MARGLPEDDAKLNPELAGWSKGEGIDILSWLGCVGNFEHAIAYARLFWPEFQLHDGCIFFGGVHQATYEEWLRAMNGNKTSLQVVMNQM